MPTSICILVSGTGTGMDRILDAIKEKRIDCRVAGIIADRKGTGAEEKAAAHGHSVIVVSRKDPDFAGRIDETVSRINPDLVILSGFLSILPPSLVDRFKNRIINTHPALLPCFGGMGFYGLKVHEAVIRSGSRYSGCTIHFVTGEVDSGPIISQRVVPVFDDDTPETLAHRVKEAEHELMEETLILLTTRRFSVSGKRVSFS